MMQLAAIIGLFPDVAEVELTHWIARGWVQPDGGDPPVFTEIDVARVRLIRDLRRDLELPEDVMPLVLSLLDQVYELRGTVRSMVRVIDAQPEPVRAALRAALAAEPPG